MLDLIEWLMSYETLRVIWWLFMGVLLIGFAVMDGFDLGVGALLPFLGRTDSERRVIINAIAPTWEGNQVWLILGAGAIFAAWPAVYGAAFSGFFIVLIVTLFALILRPVGFKYRSLIGNPRWRAFWDWCLFIGAVIPSVVFGVAFGNLLLGVPFHFDDDLRVFYTGSFWGLLNPFGLLAGVISLSMLLMHGAVFLQLKAGAPIRDRAQSLVRRFGIALIASFVLAGLAVVFVIDGYVVTHFAGTEGASNPLTKEVIREHGAWLDNYGRYPLTILAPLLGIGATVLTIRLSSSGRAGLAFITSGLAIGGVILTAGFAMFPFIMPSSSDPGSSLTVWDATSSLLTLRWMFWGTVIFLPIIIFYTSWVYSKMRGPVTLEAIERDTGNLY